MPSKHRIDLSDPSSADEAIVRQSQQAAHVFAHVADALRHLGWAPATVEHGMADALAEALCRALLAADPSLAADMRRELLAIVDDVRARVELAAQAAPKHRSRLQN